MKENRGTAKREDAVENFIVEDCSSDENADNNVIPSGAFPFCIKLVHFFFFLNLFSSQ